MSVTSNVSSIEVNYAASVFEKTYMGLLRNELDIADYCDPYCRSITSVNVTRNQDSLVTAKQIGNCDMELKLIFSIEGTFWGCDDTEFPGLFASSHGDRHLLLTERTSLRSQRLNRLLDGGVTSCALCSGESSGSLSAPTSDEFLDAMNQFVTIIPDICELKLAGEVVEQSQED